MTCWSPWCPSVAMSKLDQRVCWVHAIRYVIRGEPLPLSVVPIQELVRRMLQRPHPDVAGETWGLRQVAEELGVSHKHVDRLMRGPDQAQSLRIAIAERWADRFHLHPLDIWGDAYARLVYQEVA